jgi:GT2 family glycosyltransferase
VLTISIVNYCGWRDTDQCIRALSTICDQLDYRIIVRDNSEVSEIAFLQDSLRDVPSRVLYFCSGDNGGFGRGHNLNFQAVDHCAEDIFLILNPDIQFPDLGVVARMLEECTGNQILSCAIETAAPKGVWFSGGAVGRISGIPMVSRRRFSSDVRRVDFVTGCCLMIPCTLFAKLGGFDERYFMYSEDVDLCLRAHRIGAEIRVVNTHIVHRVGSGEKGTYSDLYLYEGTKNRLLCMRRHRRGILLLGIACTCLKYGILRTIQLAVYSRSPLSQIRAVWRGILEGAFGSR